MYRNAPYKPSSSSKLHLCFSEHSVTHLHHVHIQADIQYTDFNFYTNLYSHHPGPYPTLQYSYHPTENSLYSSLSIPLHSPHTPTPPKPYLPPSPPPPPSLSFSYYAKMQSPSAQHYDAIIVPGGGLHPVSSLPQPWVCARLDAALKLSERTKYFILLSRGTTHRPPPLDDRAYPIDESAASAAYLLNNGIKDPRRILLETWSLDTIGNAYFATKMICQPMNLRSLCLITSQFHMPRTRAIFEWVFSLDSNAAPSHFHFLVTPNLGLTPPQIAARQEKEAKALHHLNQATIPMLNTFEKLATFLFQRHAAYNTSNLPSSTNHQIQTTDDHLTNTY